MRVLVPAAIIPLLCLGVTGCIDVHNPPPQQPAATIVTPGPTTYSSPASTTYTTPGSTTYVAPGSTTTVGPGGSATVQSGY